MKICKLPDLHYRRHRNYLSWNYVILVKWLLNLRLVNLSHSVIKVDIGDGKPTFQRHFRIQSRIFQLFHYSNSFYNTDFQNNVKFQV